MGNSAILVDLNTLNIEKEEKLFDNCRIARLSTVDGGEFIGIAVLETNPLRVDEDFTKLETHLANYGMTEKIIVWIWTTAVSGFYELDNDGSLGAYDNEITSRDPYESNGKLIAGRNTAFEKWERVPDWNSGNSINCIFVDGIKPKLDKERRITNRDILNHFDENIEKLFEFLTDPEMKTSVLDYATSNVIKHDPRPVCHHPAVRNKATDYTLRKPIITTEDQFNNL